MNRNSLLSAVWCSIFTITGVALGDVPNVADREAAQKARQAEQAQQAAQLAAIQKLRDEATAYRNTALSAPISDQLFIQFLDAKDVLPKDRASVSADRRKSEATMRARLYSAGTKNWATLGYFVNDFAQDAAVKEGLTGGQIQHFSDFAGFLKDNLDASTAFVEAGKKGVPADLPAKVEQRDRALSAAKKELGEKGANMDLSAVAAVLAEDDVKDLLSEVEAKLDTMAVGAYVREKLAQFMEGPAFCSRARQCSLAQTDENQLVKPERRKSLEGLFPGTKAGQTHGEEKKP